MRRTALITTAVLALSLAPAVHAQPGYGYQDRYDNRYPSSYPDVVHMDRVSALAHEIDQNATWIYQQYARNNRRPDRSEYRALEGLRNLGGSAAHFHDEVESYRRNPRHTADDFARLERAFSSADRALRQISPRPYVDRGMERIYRMMNELSRYYGRRAGAYGTWGHDRYDGNDRYDRGNDRYDRYDRYDRGDRDHDHDHDHDGDPDGGYRPPR